MRPWNCPGRALRPGWRTDPPARRRDLWPWAPATTADQAEVSRTVSAASRSGSGGIVRALVYHGPGRKSWDDVADPEIQQDTDAVVRVDAVTICGTDLHILKGDVPAVTEGRILGHDAVGTVTAVVTGVKTVKV